MIWIRSEQLDTLYQHQALLAIAGFPDRDQITVSELAERLQVRHHSAVGLVDRLAAQDLVEREPGIEDRRQVYISLTAQGNGVLAQLSASHREELRRIGPQLHLLLDRLTAEDEVSSHTQTEEDYRTNR